MTLFFFILKSHCITSFLPYFSFFFFFLNIRRPPNSTLFPSPPLFRSLRPGGAAHSQRRRLDRTGCPFPHPAAQRVRDRARTRALLPPGAAVPAALPAVLARQPHRPHVGGAVLHRRGADSGVAVGAAALPVPRAFAHLPLVPHPAADRGPDGAQGGARGRAPRRPRQAGR